MTPAYLNEKLIEACESGNLNDVKRWLEAGAEPNFNLKKPINALGKAIEANHHPITLLLLEHGATVKEHVLQRAIEKDKAYLKLLLPNFETCQDKKLLLGVLLAAINLNDFKLAQQAINQGAKPASLFISAILKPGSTKILKLLLDNGFNIHAERNIILSQWMGSTLLSGWGDSNKFEQHDLLAFVADYYLDKPNAIEKFSTLRVHDKALLFKIGLSENHFNMMKFATLIGADKNEALNYALYRYYEQQKSNYQKIDYDIIAYLLNADIQFKKIIILNAVSFHYTELLNALSKPHDLAYAYEMAYKYQKEALQKYLIERGVSKEAQSIAIMKVAAIKGDMKTLRNTLNEGADIKAINQEVLIEIIHANQIESLKYLHASGVVLDASLNECLNNAMSMHKAFETISYLIEVGLDITYINHLPYEYKKQYPIMADMSEKRFNNIFSYTLYLAKVLYPTIKNKQKEKEEVLQKIAELSSMPYVIKRSKEKSLEA